jgi:hypothetical protein
VRHGQAWGVLESQQGNIDLARQLFKCAVKADPKSEASWLVSNPSLTPPNLCLSCPLFFWGLQHGPQRHMQSRI